MLYLSQGLQLCYMVMLASGESEKSRGLDSTAFIQEGGKERARNASRIFYLSCFLHTTGSVSPLSCE